MDLKADLNKPVKNPFFFTIIALIVAVVLVIKDIYNQENVSNINSGNDFKNSAPVYNGPVTTINNYIDSNKKADILPLKNNNEPKQTNISYSVKTEDQNGGQTANTINNK